MKTKENKSAPVTEKGVREFVFEKLSKKRCEKILATHQEKGLLKASKFYKKSRAY